MISKNEVKYIQSLYHKKNREAEGLFIAEGPKIVEELLESSFEVIKIFATEDWQPPAAMQVMLQTVTTDELQKISVLQAANQVLALVRQPKPGTFPPLKGRLSLALDNIQDPGNLGTIIRIADWFGVNTILAGEQTVELYNPKVIQATMGSFVRVTVHYGELRQMVQDAVVPVYGAMLQGQNVFETGNIAEGLLVIGNESKGISPELANLVTHPVTIPRYGGAESLNAAVATGIILSHVV